MDKDEEEEASIKGFRHYIIACVAVIHVSISHTKSRSLNLNIVMLALSVFYVQNMDELFQIASVFNPPSDIILWYDLSNVVTLQATVIYGTLLFVPSMRNQYHIMLNWSMEKFLRFKKLRFEARREKPIEANRSRTNFDLSAASGTR